MQKIKRKMSRGYLNIAIVAFAILLSSCQSEKNREIFDDFEGEEGVYMLKLPPSLFMGIMDNEAGPGKEELGKVNLVKLMFFDENKAGGEREPGDIHNEIIRKFDRYGYEMALQFSSSGTNISAYMLENEEYVSDIMVVLNGDEGLIGLGLSGRLDGRALMDFALNMDYQELGDLIDIDGFSL